MHYLGLVILKQPTREALDAAMAPHRETDEGGHWDWYRAGGRWDGWLLGEDEMKRRETHQGFNFDDRNDNVERNSCKVRDLPPDLEAPYFVLVEGIWIEKQSFREDFKDGDPISTLVVKNDNYDEQLEVLKKTHGDKWAVVVDVHS